MKNYLWLILSIPIILILHLVSSTHSFNTSSSSSLPNKCFIKHETQKITCNDKPNSTIELKDCADLLHHIHPPPIPHYLLFADKSINPYFQTTFFKMYHPKTINQSNDFNTSKLIIQIAENINEYYANRTLCDRARLMLNELLLLEREDTLNKYRKYERLFKNLREMDMFYCRAFNYNHFVYPVVTVDERKEYFDWYLALSFGALVNESGVIGEMGDGVGWRHMFMVGRGGRRLETLKKYHGLSRYSEINI